ncbi:hypothetical protein M405DRAFT_840394 [Rhizopogon salebrosus TDB-379]|nr:hypothetical protein M405DRAFT_840394 [Rhizopogon salebrosus TDB-379]
MFNRFFNRCYLAAGGIILAQLGDCSDGAQADPWDIFTDDSLDPVYKDKARILNDALQEIGMGKYQRSSLASTSVLHLHINSPQFSTRDSSLWWITPGILFNGMPRDC